jgi:hypothetical protein
VVVTILKSGTTPEPVSNSISTPILPAGSVTVLKAPSAGTFTLDMGNTTLTLNKGYKLQDISITSNFSGTSNPPPAAVKITHPTAGLASVGVTCTGGGTSSSVACVEVAGPGSHTLKDVTVDVKNSNEGNIGILINANASLSIVGGMVKLTNAPTQKPITLIQSDGVLIATGLTVDMSGGNDDYTAHTKNSIGIVLNAAGSSVTNSTIKVNKGPGSGSPANATGIDVQAGPSTVENNIFIGPTDSTPNAIGINGASNAPNASTRNAFVQNFTAIVQN